MRSAALCVAALSLCGCATTYQPVTLTGGYTETKVSETIYTVYSAANIYSTLEAARKIAMLRAGEITRANGFDRFRIVGGEGARPRPPYGLGYDSIYTIKFVGPKEPSDPDTYRVEDVEKFRAELSKS